MNDQDNPADTLLTIRDLGVHRGGRWILRHVSFSLKRGEIVTLIGPNGGGKTTAAKAILGILEYDEGRVARARKIKIGYVPQKPHIDRMIPLSVRRLMTLTETYPKKQIAKALAQVGIESRIDAQIDDLSGGEFQRALLARALLQSPDLLVLDEPLEGVDFAATSELYQHIRAIRDENGCAVLLISHDLHIVMRETDKVLCINGHVCCSGSPQAIASDPEYHKLFGKKASKELALYAHAHDHSHAPSGKILEE